MRTRLTTSGLMGLDIVDVRRMVVLKNGRRKEIVVFRCNLLRSSVSLYRVLEDRICFERMNRKPSKLKTNFVLRNGGVQILPGLVYTAPVDRVNKEQECLIGKPAVILIQGLWHRRRAELVPRSSWGFLFMHAYFSQHDFSSLLQPPPTVSTQPWTRTSSIFRTTNTPQTMTTPRRRSSQASRQSSTTQTPTISSLQMSTITKPIQSQASSHNIMNRPRTPSALLPLNITSTPCMLG